MQEKSDAQLLRDYAERGTESAFGEIVMRHADLVYSAALRRVNSPELANDVAQSVFTDLARKAQPLITQIAANSSLVGWLFRSTRFAALNQLRDDRRRTAHERQAVEQLLSNSETAQDWELIRPVLDEAMDDLSDDDRDAVLLRYFKKQDFRGVGLALGVSDDTAQKRVSRAVERLREFFAKRGIAVDASGLVVVISANAVQAAPVGLAVTISTAAALAGTTIPTTTKAIAMTTLQKTLITATLVAAVGAGLYEARQASTLRSQAQSLQQQQAPLAEQIEQLTRDREQSSRELVALREENQRLNRNTDELLRLRGEVSLLRRASSIPAKPVTLFGIEEFLKSPPATARFLVKVATASSLSRKNDPEPQPGAQYVFMWKDKDVFLKQLADTTKTEPGQAVRVLQPAAGRFKGNLWDYAGEHLTTYGVEDEKEDSLTKTGIQFLYQTFINLGIQGLSPGSFRAEGKEFTASLDSGMRIRGGFSKNNDGNVTGISYVVQEAGFKYDIQFHYGDKGAVRFPQVIEVFGVEPTERIPLLRFQVEEVDLAPQIQPDALNPYVIFPNAIQMIHTNKEFFKRIP